MRTEVDHVAGLVADLRHAAGRAFSERRAEEQFFAHRAQQRALLAARAAAATDAVLGSPSPRLLDATRFYLSGAVLG